MAATLKSTYQNDQTKSFKKNQSRLSPMTLEIAYESELELCSKFLETFSLSKESNLETVYKYKQILQEISDLKSSSITIEIDDIEMCESIVGGKAFAERISSNTQRYIDLFCKAIDQLLPSPSPEVNLGAATVSNIIASHRLSRQQQHNLAVKENSRHSMNFPPGLLRQYTLHFKPISNEKAVSIRQIRADQVGSLIAVRGLVTKVTEVKPKLAIATYTCEKCLFEVYQEITTTAVTPLFDCPSEECKKNNVRGVLYMQTRGSVFHKFQEARIQELTDQVPMGHIPRSITVYLAQDLTRSLNPGDEVIVSGIFLPRPYTGFRAIRAGLLTDTFLSASHIAQIKQKYGAHHECSISSSEQQQLEILMQMEPASVYNKLSKSIAPEIFGHEDVKKALLLLMTSGVTKEMSDGMKIRGDLNICLMGDPGVAKSQLLKWIAKISPRGVYTTGKGSSGVGLTAAVTKDSLTNEMVLEGGALVLADNGICCIDEFDKMEDSDRTAIHEVMEQQTVSIAKAGITTSLNARTSILAAANPLHGRYNPKKSPKENINLPYALLSRFDILFLILDKPNLDDDTRLALHVTSVHRTGAAPELAQSDTAGNDEFFSPQTIRNYISKAKQYAPYFPEELKPYIAGVYVALRQNDNENHSDTYTTPRTLLALLRISQALAKLRLSTVVSQADVDEAVRLIDSSRVSLATNSNETRNQGLDTISKIYTLILNLINHDITMSKQAREIPMELVREKIIKTHKFSPENLALCIEEFERCQVWKQEGNKLKIFH